MSAGARPNNAAAVLISPIRTDAELKLAAGLFGEYAASLDVDLNVQGFAQELAGLPGGYAPPRGELLLARDAAGAALGCIALRPLAGAACEIKRLYVRPEARGRDVGAALVGAVTRTARDLGYGEIRLDTLPSMTAAIALYRRLGFGPIPAYGEAVLPGLMYFGKAVQD